MAASVKKDPVAAFRLPRMHAGRDRNVLTEAGNIFLIIRLCLLWTGPDDDLFNQGTVFNGRFRPVT